MSAVCPGCCKPVDREGARGLWVMPDGRAREYVVCFTCAGAFGSSAGRRELADRVELYFARTGGPQ